MHTGVIVGGHAHRTDPYHYEHSKTPFCLPPSQATNEEAQKVGHDSSVSNDSGSTPLCYLGFNEGSKPCEPLQTVLEGVWAENSAPIKVEPKDDDVPQPTVEPDNARIPPSQVATQSSHHGILGPPTSRHHISLLYWISHLVELHRTIRQAISLLHRINRLQS